MSNRKNKKKTTGDARKAVRIDAQATPLQNFNGGRRGWTQQNGKKAASRNACRKGNW